MTRTGNKQQQRFLLIRSRRRTILWGVGCCIFGLSCFYMGLLVGTRMAISSSTPSSCWSATDPRLISIIQARVKREVEQQQQTKIKTTTKTLLRQNHQQQHQQIDYASDATSPKRFPKSTMGKIVSGIGRVNRIDFATQLDMGIPIDDSKNSMIGNEEVLILYNHFDAIPSSNHLTHQAIQAQYASTTFLEAGEEKDEREGGGAGGDIPLFDTIHDATENCNNLHVVLTDTTRSKQCIAIMGQYESFQIQKFMRLPPPDTNNGDDGGPVNSKLPLRLVNRSVQSNGRNSMKPPTKEQTLEYWNTILIHYLSNLQDMLHQLEPIAKVVATASTATVASSTPTIIVMVCNYGQSELLLNFVCNARSKQLDHVLSSILLFATDIETYELATGLGLTSFYHVNMFGGGGGGGGADGSNNSNNRVFPKEAAKEYGDTNFMSMMTPKLFCVQMINMLGYDILFQDVDVIWYQNPLDWFQRQHEQQQQQQHEKTLPFDIYFQEDGNHSSLYAPYSANTGFYYIKYNDRTQYLLNTLVVSGGDLILSSHSHQIAVIAILNDHVSRYGLRVKVLKHSSTTRPEFPGGYTFHHNYEYMKDLVTNQFVGTSQMPYIFHMSWTLNKDSKILYFRQMGEWYLQDICIGQTHDEILSQHHRHHQQRDEKGKKGNNEWDLIAPCCAVEALITCHYRDKPSKIPCKDSPPIDDGKPSFW